MKPETKIVWNVGLLLIGFTAMYWVVTTLKPSKKEEVL
jgi:hypothetical protein